MRIRLVAPLLLIAAVAAAQQPDLRLPRFRAGTNLVTVDAYVSKDGTAVTDLRTDEIEILEDGRPQKIEAFRLHRAVRPSQTTTTTSDPSVGRAALTDPDARVFAIFIDTWHINAEGSHKGASPVSALLQDVIGADDLVGWTTPDLPARSMPLTRRTAGIERVLEQSRMWNERDKVTTDPREGEFMVCYPDDPRRFPQFIGVAKELIERRRERKTMLALGELVTHLGTLRDDRKFVLLLTEGWVRFRPNHRLDGELIRGVVPQQAPVRVGADGRLTTQAEPGNVDFDACERERVILATLDHSRTLEELAQRANRENVTFYVVDPRGATPFDDAIGSLRPAIPPEDRVRMASRQNGLRELAEQTDGVALLNATYTREHTARMMADLNSYYLMSYYSSNDKLDGRFRKIVVRVKRPGVEVRARPGYLAPTEADVLGASAITAFAGPTSAVTRALEALAPARGNLPVRIQAAGSRGRIRAIVELDAATAKQPEWAAGGSLRAWLEAEGKGGTARLQALPAVTVELAAGQRSIPIGFEATLTAGRYVVRAELMPRAIRSPINISTTATVPEDSALAGADGLAARRGPSTGLAYVPTADQRFRRTERLRVEVPLMAEGVAGTGRVLTREGQPLPLVVTYAAGVADVTLAPLAAGEYVLELLLSKDGATETIAYGFRIIP